MAPAQKKAKNSAKKKRIDLLAELGKQRGSTVISYLTSVRSGAGAQISGDAVRTFFDHLLLLEKRPIPKLDIFLCSNGGDGVVPWRLISLFREFAEHIGVLIPYRAYSAATMLALGADEIIMHPFGEMGPIDPTVSNDYNPVDSNSQRLGISVEDVKAYISFVRDTVGIRHEDELIKAVEILANRVHPLALGNVERFISQSRMIARKILLTHMNDDGAKHRIDETIDILASKLYFHGHPINRREAAEELNLKVNMPQPALETSMWNLYLEYETLLKNNVIYDPIGELWRTAPAMSAVVPPPPGPPIPQVPVGHSVTMDDTVAVIESDRLTSTFNLSRRFVVVGQGAQSEPLVRTEVLNQGWRHQPVR